MSSQWVDASGSPWRFSAGTQTWQRLVDGSWRSGTPPTGGLKRADGLPGNGSVVVVERTGPRGASGRPGPPGPPGSDLSTCEVLSEQYQDGVNEVFPLSSVADLSQAVQVFRNGLLETPGIGYTVTPTHVTFTTPPLDDDVLTVIYQKAQ